MATKTQPKKAKARPKVKGLTRKELDEELRSLVAVCSVMLENQTGGDLKEAANLTRLSPMTVWRLWNGRFSRCVRFGTVQQLAAAVGLQLIHSEYGGGLTIRLTGAWK